jgi:hypothetical protein
LRFDGQKLEIHLEAYEALKEWYLQTYSALAEHYLSKKDAKLFLERFTCKKEGVYVPNDATVASFVNYYWALHQSMGREIDESVKREDWLL